MAWCRTPLVALVAVVVPLTWASVSHAKPPSITVTQSYSDADTGDGISCTEPGPAHETHWYRRFDLLDDHGVAKGFRVTSAVVRLSDVITVDRSLPFHVAIHQIDPGDALKVANLEPLGTVDLSLDADDSFKTLDVRLSASAAKGKDLVVEAWVPDLLADEDVFLAANRKPELADDYIRAPFCGSPEPVTIASIGFPKSNHVLYAKGTPVECASAAKKATKKRKALREAEQDGTRAQIAKAEAELRKALKKKQRECSQPELPELEG